MCVLNFPDSGERETSKPHKMPMDYGSYLLSSSPPGFDIHYKNYVLLQEGLDIHDRSMRRPRPTGLCPNDTQFNRTDSMHKSVSDIELNNVEHICDEKRRSLQEDELKCDVLNNNNSLKRSKKKVSFADENGLPIQHVRVFSESPNSPPIFRKSFLASLTKGATAGITETPPLVLKFTQPASNYVMFRQKLERLNVSLENVILKDYTFMGTVKVRNISFEKAVKIRCTFDGWEKHEDISAKYVNNQNGSFSPYDTFSFQVNVPPNHDPKKSVEFVVCYEVDGKEYWDNNDGENYKVMSADWNANTKHEPETPVFDLESEISDWPRFSSWTHTDNTIPYY